MKRKRGNAKRKSSNRQVVGSDEAISHRSYQNGKVQSGLGDFDSAKFDSRMETETPQAVANMTDLQSDVGKQGAVNEGIGFSPDSLRKMIISIISDLSKEPGGITTKLSNGSGASTDSPISNASLFQPHGERIDKENSKVLHQDPRYRKQELRAALSVIKKTMKSDAAGPFSIPVDPIALGIPDYFDVIDTPMDFGTICNNLENGLKYMNSEDVYKDVQYVWENCYTYNKKGDYILELMDGVKTNFTKYWTAAGLYTEPPPGGGGYTNAPPPSEAPMRRSTPRQGCPVSPVIDKVGPSEIHPYIPAPLYKQPQLSSNQPQPSLRHQDTNAGNADGGLSPLMPPTLSTPRGSKHGKECPLGPAANKLVHQQHDELGTSQAQVYQPPSIYTQAYERPSIYDQLYQPPQHESASIQKRRGRGPGRCLKLLTTVGRISVAINELGEPVGDNAPKLTSFLGLMARDGNLAPLTLANWSKISNENKEKMWQIVQLRFDVDPQIKSWVMKSLASRWRKFKSLLKANHYDTHETDEERLADRDSRVLPDQWSILISQWNSEKWQSISAQNKANRAKQKFYHATGSKSFARVFEEEKAKRPDGEEPTRAELFILTRTRKNGQPVNDEAASVISQLRERTQHQETLEKNNEPQGDIFSQVMGPPGRRCSLLYGIGSSSDLGTRNPTRADSMRMVSEAKSEVREMKEKVVSMEQTCAQMAAQMATMMSMMASMQKTSPAKHITNVVTDDTSDASEDSLQQPVRTSTSRRAVPSRQTRARKKM